MSAMGSKTCMQIVVDILIRSRPSPISVRPKEYAVLRQFNSGSPLRPSLGGASLHTLPGNRFSSYPIVSPNFSSSLVSCRTKSTRKADVQISMNLGVCNIEKLEDFTPLSDETLQQEVTGQINETVDKGNAGRLYAVVYIRGIQHKVTAGDLVVVKYDFPPNVGDRLRLEKVLAVGGQDFSLIGQPLLSRNVVRVDATVVEKTLSHNRVWFVYQKRRNFKKFHLYREIFTVLAINSIQVARLPEQQPEIESQSSQQLD